MTHSSGNVLNIKYTNEGKKTERIMQTISIKQILVLQSREILRASELPEWTINKTYLLPIVSYFRRVTVKEEYMPVSIAEK